MHQSSGFPSPFTPENEKFDFKEGGSVPKKDFFKRAVDYAEEVHINTRSNENKKITKLKESYVGHDEFNLPQLNTTDGVPNTVTVRDYGLSKNKIDQLLGEWLTQSISGSVESINTNAKAAKLEQVITLLTIKDYKPYIDKLRKEAGVPVFENIEVPEDEKEFNELLNAKSRNEMIMQYFLNDMIQRGNIKLDFFENLKDVLLGSKCFGKAYIAENGKVLYRPIDSRFALYEESYGDPFLKRSPYLGERRPMYIHELLMEYPEIEDDKEIRDRIKSWSENGTETSSLLETGYFSMDQNRLLADTSTIEFYGFEPFRRKITIDPISKNPLQEADLSERYYQDNMGKLKKGVDRGKWQIETRYKKVVYESTKIGTDIYIRYGKKKNVIASINDPFMARLSYQGLLFNTTNGKRVSVMKMLELLKEQYNIVRFQINRELAKSKGLIITYDRAFLPKVEDTGKAISMTQVIHKMVNHGYYDYNSAADGNASGEKIDAEKAIRVHDLGLSSAMPVLIQLGQDIERVADMISGINDDRQGLTPASSTATNAVNNIQNSRFKTAPINYFFNRFCEETLLLMLEYKKVSAAFLTPEEDSMLIGDENIGFLQITPDIANDDYRVKLTDGSKEAKIREYLRNYLMPQAVNAGEQTLEDAAESEMAETLVEAKKVLADGWKKIKQVQAMQQQAQEQSKQVMAQQSIAAMKEDREDKQSHEVGLEIVKGIVKTAVNTQEALNSYDLAQRQAIADQNQTLLENSSQTEI